MNGPKIVKRGSEYWITGGGLQEDQGPYREKDVAEDDLVGLSRFLEEKWVKDGEGGYVRSGKGAARVVDIPDSELWPSAVAAGKRVTLVVKPMRKRAGRVPVAVGKRGIEAAGRRPPKPFVNHEYPVDVPRAGSETKVIPSPELIEAVQSRVRKLGATRKAPKHLKPTRKLIRRK